jgi:hypothetical protein
MNSKNNQMVESHKMRLAWIVALFWLLSPQPSEACTLWGAVGASVQRGGALIAKNRDWVPDHFQELAVLRPATGFQSLVLRAVGGEEPGVKAGVNEKGLVVVSATASQVPRAERDKAGQRKGLMSHLLATCAGVDEVLKNITLFYRPAFYLIADRRELAAIEVAPDGQRSVTRRDSGTLSHTNHYCAIDSQTIRQKPGPSSRARLARIDELLKTHPQPYSIDDFIRFSADQNAGPDDSIWRTGSDPTNRRTLSTWIVALPLKDSPQLYLRTANPEESEQICRLSVNEALRMKGGDRIPLAAALCNGPVR